MSDDDKGNIVSYDVSTNQHTWSHDHDDKAAQFDSPPFIVNEKGHALNTLENVMIALRTAPDLKGAFAFDEMLQDMVLGHPLPGQHVYDTSTYPHGLTEPDLIHLQEYLQSIGLKRIGKRTVQDGLTARRTEVSYHPVKNYMASLTWDGKPRVKTWLSNYLGAAETPYTREVGTMFLVAMVARIRSPGCQFDYVLILEGPQGIGKSKVCSILGGEYYSDSLPHDLGNRDTRQHLRGKWLIEIAELAGFSHTDNEKLKAFITRCYEIYRPP
jgi:predicted P-loop ATPase